MGPVDPLVAQFGEDDAWYCNILDFIRREAEGGAKDPPKLLAGPYSL